MGADYLSDRWKLIFQARYEYSQERSGSLELMATILLLRKTYLQKTFDKTFNRWICLCALYDYESLIVSKYIFSKFLRKSRCIFSFAVFAINNSMRSWIIMNLLISKIWWFNYFWRELALVNFPYATQKFFRRRKSG